MLRSAKIWILRAATFRRYNTTPNVSTLSSGYRFLSPHAKQAAGRSEVLILNSGGSQFETRPKNRLSWLSLFEPVVIEILPHIRPQLLLSMPLISLFTS